MAYSDYGAFVHRNGERRRDKEDVGVFDTDEGALPSGIRIWANIQKRRELGTSNPWDHSHHGVMGDGAIRVACYKQGLPTVWHWPQGAERPVEVELFDREKVDHFRYGYLTAEFEGHRFQFQSGEPNEATMIEPDGTVWRCEFDYGFGAGLTDIE